MFKNKKYSKLSWYSLMLATLVLGELLFYGLHLMSQLSPIRTPLQEVVNSLKIFWLISLPYVIFNLSGLMLYGPPQDPSPDVENIKTKDLTLRITYCTKGGNSLSLKRSLESVEKTINTPIFYHQKKRYVSDFFKKIEVEVISDAQLPEHIFPPHLSINTVIVPEKYQTPLRTLYKARALHYAIQKIPADPTIYVLRLDEESLIDHSTILGVIEFLQKKEERQIIGQGEILYNAHQYGGKVIITVADAIRTGDDLGRFRLQYKLKRSYFGMHGSYILIRSDIEKEIGYDNGPHASITEDAYLALKIRSMGYHFGWINGRIYEQSPFTYHEFVKQRKRWFIGISNVVKDKKIPLRNRAMLIFCRYMWAFSWLSFVVTFLNIVVPTRTSLGISMAGGFVFSAYVLIYIIGTNENLRGVNFTRKTKFYLYFLTIIFIPISTMLEAIGVISGMIKPIMNFEIVSKN